MLVILETVHVRAVEINIEGKRIEGIQLSQNQNKMQVMLTLRKLHNNNKK
jgi:hypothetical protein